SDIEDCISLPPPPEEPPPPEVPCRIDVKGATTDVVPEPVETKVPPPTAVPTAVPVGREELVDVEVEVELLFVKKLFTLLNIPIFLFY
ncbi:MAG: hypothetical protein WD876_01300, partial [Candidatus Pacearchaeota archaeon]